MQNKIITTEDGSHTIYVPTLEEHYHSTHGAINESMHIYINAGLKHLQKKEINILEIGFGTGLNAFLSLSVAIQEKLKINYFSIEKYPLSENEYTMLNYTRHIFPEYSRYFGLLHQVPWDIETLICPEFSLKKIKTDLKIFKYDGMPLFDLIYLMLPGNSQRCGRMKFLKK